MTTAPARPTYHMPAEWTPHRAVWIAWPHEREDWPGKFEPIPWVYGEIVRQLAPSEQVCIVAREDQEAEARKVLELVDVDLSRVTFAPFATDRVWLRDSGAIFVTDGDGNKVALDWHFNAWAKYDNWQCDDRLPPQMAEWLGVPCVQPRGERGRVVLEGGSIDVDGEGLLLTTEECLLSLVQERNAGFGREDYEGLFAAYLGAKKTLWLNRGIAGDDTHGHVDDVARFVGPGKVVACVEEDGGDENHEPLRENLERLRAMTDAQGRPLEVHTLPMPSPLVFERRRLPASYANFYVANKVVLVPTFNDARDREALNVLAGLFPGRSVVGIHAVDLVWGLGTLHCLTQQEPV